MAERGVFFVKESYPFFEEVNVCFPWFGGQSLKQRQRCVLSLRLNLLGGYPDVQFCEISSGSPDDIGRSLSAMALSKRLSDGRITTVESAFQSSRIYKDKASGEVIGPFPDMIMLPGRDCKRQVKELSRGLHSYEYSFEGMWFPAPIFHISLFYDYLYLNALTEPENAQTARGLQESGFDVFSDLASKALNTQARSCAIYTALYRLGLLDRVRDYDDYLELMRVDTGNRNDYSAKGAYSQVQLLNGKGGVRLLRPAVAQTADKEAVLAAFDNL